MPQNKHPVFLDVQTISTTPDPDQALIPELSEIVALSYWTTNPVYDLNGDGPTIKTVIAHPDHPLGRDEKEMLNLYTRMGKFDKQDGDEHFIAPIITWNTWTIEVLHARCAMQGVNLPRLLDRRWWGNDILPLKNHRNGPPAMSLIDYAVAYKLVDNRDFFALPNGKAVSVANQVDPDAIVAYSRARLWALRELYKIWARGNTFAPKVLPWDDADFWEDRHFDPAPNPVYTPEGAEQYLTTLGCELPPMIEWPAYGDSLLAWREVIAGLTGLEKAIQDSSRPDDTKAEYITMPLGGTAYNRGA